jgi:diguanylate cyclase (GGDEF)-like protein
MSQQAVARTPHVGLFLNPIAQRRVDFQAACSESFGRLFIADSAEQAEHLLSQQQVDLLVIDLEHFDRGLDLAALGALVRQRRGVPVLLVCPYAAGGWLGALGAFGPLDYVIGPATGAELRRRVATRLEQPESDADGAADALALLALRARAQQAVADVDDQRELAARICTALCSWPGVVHAALFHLADNDELALGAQYSPAGLEMARLLPAAGPLLQAPQRHTFPGLVAADSGEFCCLDQPEKAGNPELAIALREMGVAMAVGVPIPARGPGAPLGAISLMFDQPRRLSAEALSTLADVAQLAGFGLRVAEMARDAEQMLARLTHLATTDGLTGVAHRRRGEALLEQEVRRARRYKTPLSLIAFDIDHFKTINDRYGHPTGDAALRLVCETTQGALRCSDTLARSGGDEFLIIATHTSAIDGLKIAEKIRLVIAQTVFPGCDRLTISLAVAEAAGEESADSLMLRAGAALARAKRAGRNCVELAMQ